MRTALSLLHLSAIPNNVISPMHTQGKVSVVARRDENQNEDDRVHDCATRVHAPVVWQSSDLCVVGLHVVKRGFCAVLPILCYEISNVQ